MGTLVSYRNPRFSYIHTLADFGSSGVTSVYFNDPVTRIFDYQSKTLAGLDDTGAVPVLIYQRDLTKKATFYQLDRIIVPAGHNWGSARALNFGIWPTLDTTPGTQDPIDVADGSTDLDYWCPHDGLFEIEIDPSSSQSDALGLRIHWNHSQTTSEDHTIGELWWTNTVQPSSGIAYGWTDVIEPVMSRARMANGATYVNVLGDSQRRFTLQHIALSGNDMLLYDELLRYVGYGVKPFYFDHPDSADKERDINTFEDDTDLVNLVNATVTDVLTDGPDPTKTVSSISATLTGTASADLYNTNFESSTDTDWRNSILQIDMKLPSPIAWFDDPEKIKIKVFDTSLGFSMYYPMTGYQASASADKWVRCSMDIELDAVEGESTGDQAGFCDLSAIQLVRFEFSPSSTASIRIANMRIIEKSKQPVLVEIASYSKRQESRVPVGPAGTTWTVDLEMIEVTT